MHKKLKVFHLLINLMYHHYKFSLRKKEKYLGIVQARQSDSPLPSHSAQAALQF